LKILLLILLIISFQKSLFSQIHPEKKITLREINSSNESIKNVRDISEENISPHVFVYVGAGLALGGRVGVMFKIVDRFTGEFNYGYNIGNFFAASDEEILMSGGINYHKKPYLLNTSLTITSFPKIYHYEKRDPRIFYSLNIGYLNINGPGVHLLGRAGLILVIKDSSFEANFIRLNLDIGIGWGL
jgi:hypothetical protein